MKPQDKRIASKVRGVVAVQGACVNSVNGVYRYAGTCDYVGKYTKEGVFNDKLVTFTLYRCKHQDMTRRWYISIVAKNHRPGTKHDLDLFTALANVADNPFGEAPPECGWKVVVGSGLKGKGPMCLWIADHERQKTRYEMKPLMCVVCLVNPVNYVFVPCGHPCLCSECVTKRSWVGEKCPVGRCQITSAMKIYGTIVEEKSICKKC